jgi:hypothetical protein
LSAGSRVGNPAIRQEERATSVTAPPEILPQQPDEIVIEHPDHLRSIFSGPEKEVLVALVEAETTSQAMRVVRLGSPNEQKHASANSARKETKWSQWKEWQRFYSGPKTQERMVKREAEMRTKIQQEIKNKIAGR